MTSQLVTWVDALVTDLTLNVAGLTPVTLPVGVNLEVHKYAAWDPELLTIDKDRHLSIAPAGEIVVNPLANESHEHYTPFLIQCWETAYEGSQGQRDEAKAAAFLQLYENVRARLYLISNETLGASEQNWMTRARFPTQVHQVHWFEIEYRADFYLGFS